MWAAAVMSCTCYFIIVLLLFAFGLLFCLLGHLAVITLAIHTSCVRDWRKQQGKGNEER